MKAAGARQVTKSIRLSEDESRMLADLSSREHLAEGTLLRKLVLDALDAYQLQQAVLDYERGEINLGEAAIRAGVGLQRMMAELERRGVGLGTADHVAESLENLAELFGGSPELRAALAERKTDNHSG